MADMETTSDHDEGASGRSRSWKPMAWIAFTAFIGGILAMAWIAKNVSMPSWAGGSEPTEQVSVNAAAPAPVPANNVTAQGPVPAPTAPQLVLPQQVTPAATAQIGSIEQRIAEASAAAEDAAGNATNAEDLLVAFAVRRTIDRGDQLGFLEPQLRQRFAGQPNVVNTIIAGARQPVTLATLSVGLDNVSPVLVGSEEGWFSAFGAEVRSFFTVRDKGTPSAAPSARLQRARQLLLGGQVEAAAAEVAAMPRTEESVEWLANAKHYVDVHRALDVIEAQVLQPVATQPPPAR